MAADGFPIVKLEGREGCSCLEIMAADSSRHFQGCARRADLCEKFQDFFGRWFGCKTHRVAWSADEGPTCPRKRSATR